MSLSAKILYAVVVFTAACPVWADSGTSALELTRERAVAMALNHNRDVLLARQLIHRAEAQLAWVGRLDNPTLGLSFRNDAFGLDEDEDSFEVAFEQALPLTSRLRHAKALQGAQVVLAQAEVTELKRSIAYEVDLAVTRLAATRQRRGDQQDIFELSKEIAGFLEKQVRRGEASALDVTQAALTTGLLEQKIKTVDAEAAQQLGHLRLLLGVAASVPITLDVSMALPEALPPHQDALEDVVKRRPDFVVSLAEAASSDLEAALAHAQRWEDVVVRVFAEWDHSVDAPKGLERNTLAGVGVSIPLPLMQRNQGAIARAAQNQRDARLKREALGFRIENELARARQGCEDTHAIALALNGELMSLARKQLSEVQRAYQQGQTSLVVVQRAQEQLLESQTAAMEANRAYHEAEAQWRYAAAVYTLTPATPDGAK